ncbi:hypothetical protein ARMGADRAFT_1032545 [Armillaria gallica]|uniref:F-box domain-containing protein n=1 Tax=Armillaria gallica TaxID=47427 RepID=A0A2H3D5L8_ARMGA|nr:hypothetical protein ARMGADRAFT_1032545 [Armillaria gallica]
MSYNLLIDTPYDHEIEDAILAEIDNLNESTIESEILDQIKNGDHLFYHYLECLTHIASQRDSVLYYSLFNQFPLIMHFPIYMESKLWMPLLSDRDHQPVPDTTGYLPSELWTAIFKLMDRDQLPELHLVCAYWHNIATSLVFTTVQLSLPFAWQLSD